MKYCLFAAITLCLSSIAVQTNETQSSNPVVIMTTSMGLIHVELFPDRAPATVEAFLKFVKEKRYDNTLIHSVIPGCAIRGGRMDINKVILRPTMVTHNEKDAELNNEEGTIAMKRIDDVAGPSCEFVINITANPLLDKTQEQTGYCVFGRIIRGDITLKRMQRVQLNAGGEPVNPMVVEHVREYKAPVKQSATEKPGEASAQ